MKRPIGITVIAAILLLIGSVCVVYAALLYTQVQSGGQLSHGILKNWIPADCNVALDIFWFATVGATSFLVPGVGLWFLQEWARWGVLAVVGVPFARSLVLAVVAAGMDPSEFSRHFGSVFWLYMVLSGFIILYLIRLDVRQAFARPDRYTETFDPARPKRSE